MPVLTKSSGEYLLTRTAAESERLEKQFRAWQANIGYLMHPAITPHEHMRIADVGTGTGIWLREIAGTLPRTCQLDAFDISDALFPKKATLPENITFYFQNFLRPFPEEFLGKYDVVNVRVMVVALSSDEWEPAIRNLMTLLRPGGHLQWTDCAAHECKVIAPEGTNPVYSKYWIELFQKTLVVLGKTPNIQNLHGFFKKSGLQSCEERIYTLDNPGARDMLNIAVADGISHSLTAALKLHKLDEIQSEDQITALREAVLRELKELNCWYCFDVYVVIGKKAV